MNVQDGMPGQFLQIVRDLSTGTRQEDLCVSLAQGLVRAGVDHCQVAVGVAYEGREFTAGESLAVEDADPEMHTHGLHRRYQMDEYPTIREAIRRREPLWSGDPDTGTQLSDRERALMADLGITSFLVCPMSSLDRTVGFVLAGKRGEGGFEQRDIVLYQAMAGHAAGAIQASRVSTREALSEVQTFRALAENAPYGLLMATPDGEVTYANQTNHEMFAYDYTDDDREMIGLSIAQVLTPELYAQFQEQRSGLLAGASWQVDADGVRKDGSTFSLLMLAFGILDDEGQPLALVCINRDVTEQKRLEAERERLNREMLVARERLISELSAPLIPITENILVLPLIGAVDSARAQLIMESLLDGIDSYNAEVVIIDVTGVPLLDTAVANHLLQMTNAAGLVGARTILVGVMPKVAQTIVELGVDLSSITTRSNLQGGVAYALRLKGQHITSI